MIKDFINYTHQIFPSIDTNIKNGIIDLLNQYDTFKPNWFSSDLEGLSQGDIIDSVPFNYYDSDNNEQVMFTKGMILSNSCDVTRDKYIIIAPLIPFDHDFSPAKAEAIRKNIVSGKMCLSTSPLENYYIDFSMSNSFKRDNIIKLFKEEKIKRDYSLSQFGFYFLCSKISIYYLRVENYDLFNGRNDNVFVEQL